LHVGPFWRCLFGVFGEPFVVCCGFLVCAWCHCELFVLISPFAPDRDDGEVHLFNSVY